MLVVTLLLSTLTAAPAVRPRNCPTCGVYSGPNFLRVVDPYLRQVDIWPEFYAISCQFEVARGSFVTLTRASCASEAAYRSGRG